MERTRLVVDTADVETLVAGEEGCRESETSFVEADVKPVSARGTRTVSLDSDLGEGCALLDSGGGGGGRGSEHAGNGSEGGSLHGDGWCVVDGIGTEA